MSAWNLRSSARYHPYPRREDLILPALSEHQTLIALVALAAIVLLARLAGELARRLHQPEVLGQLVAGFLLGPSVFGAVLPSLHRAVLLDPTVSMVLSGLSWIGAVMLLLVAGMEVDLAILRREVRPGLLAAGFAIIPSLTAGALFAWLALGRKPPGGLFLGIVLSVTAVSVASTILIERGSVRRAFAQVILAAGVASEVIVWLFVSVVSAVHGSSPLIAGIRSAIFAAAFIAFMLTAGRRFTFWTIRLAQDAAWIARGQLSLVLVLTFISAAITQGLGLHALLGAFIFGVLLNRAPRSKEDVHEGLQALTFGLFGPIFFALAGMRVDILRLGSLSAIGAVLILLIVASAVKVGFSALGARLGGRPGWEAVLVAMGLNLKGGTDVVVAVIGTELGLLSVRAYSMYAVVAILTVLFSPALIDWLERRTPPTEDEQERLQREEATRRAYVPRIERVLVPVQSDLLPSLAASVVERLAGSKHEQSQIFDITQFDVCEAASQPQEPDVAEAHDRLGEAATLDTVNVTARRVATDDVLETILETARGYDLIAVGAHQPSSGEILTLGQLQDAIIHHAQTDVLIAIDEQEERFGCNTEGRILVPTNGLEYSMAAGDIAGALGEACGSDITLLHVVHSGMEDDLRGEDERHLAENAESMMDELAFRIGRLGVGTETKVRVGPNAAEEILRELEEQPYQLVVLGAKDRGQNGRPYLGRSIRTFLTRNRTPAVLLVSR